MQNKDKNKNQKQDLFVDISFFQNTKICALNENCIIANIYSLFCTYRLCAKY